ncbi:MAG TPA: glycosyltransferase family 4 protein [Anaerolineales bacterium]|nr:glycosyltransferase family 4 protein [Anaerolineales bacterium]
MKIALIAPTSIPSRRANTIQVMKMAQALVLNGHEVHLAAPGVPPNGNSPNRTPPNKNSASDMENGLKPVEKLVQTQTFQPVSTGFESQAMNSYSSPTDSSPPYSSLTFQHHYGLTVEFPITWLTAHPRFRGYDFALRAVRFARRVPADLLYTRHPQTAALSSLLGVPTILEIHDLPQGQGKTLLRTYLKGRGQRRLIAITNALADDLNIQYRISHLSILPDGVDLSRYRDLPDPQTARASLASQSPIPNSPFPIPPSQFTIGYTGHLYPGRGTDLLLTLAARLPEFHFLLVGGNPEDVENLKAQIRKSANPQTSKPTNQSTDQPINRSPNLTLTGFIPNADLPRYQAACDLLLMPYQRHVAASSGGDIAPYLSPMKLFEYLAAGRAILSSDLPVFREVLNPENAVLLPPDNADAWVNAIRELHAHPEKRTALGSRARQDAEKYTWEARAAKMLEGLG